MCQIVRVQNALKDTKTSSPTEVEAYPPQLLLQHLNAVPVKIVHALSTGDTQSSTNRFCAESTAQYNSLCGGVNVPETGNVREMSDA